MAANFGILAQAAPEAQVLTDLYTVPTAWFAKDLCIMCCNRGPLGKFRMALAVAGAADEAKQYLYYDEVIPAGKTFEVNVGATLKAGTVVRVMQTGHIVFNVFGVEIQ